MSDNKGGSQDFWGKLEGIVTNQEQGFEMIGPYHEWLRLRRSESHRKWWSLGRLGGREERAVLFNKAHFRFWGGSDVAKRDSQPPEIAGYCYHPEREYRVLWLGNDSSLQTEAVVVRLQSMCLNGIVEGAVTCDCGDQFEMAKQRVSNSWGEGHPGMIILALHHVGKGLGPRNHALIDTMAEIVAIRKGLDPDPAKIDRWWEPFVRISSRPEWDELEDQMVILKHFDITKIGLIAATNNPRKINRLKQEGFAVQWVPLQAEVNDFNRLELSTKSLHGHNIHLPLADGWDYSDWPG